MPDVTYPQIEQLMGFLGTGNARHDRFQRLLEQADIVRRLAQGETLGANPYAKQRAKPAYLYPEGYAPRPIEDRVHTLLERLGDLDARHVPDLARGWDLSRYPKADGLHVEPKVTVLAARLKIERPFAEGWGQLLQAGPLAALATTRNFHNWREGELTPDRFRILPSAASALLYLEYIQPGDFLVYPAHTGLPFAGFSVLDSRWEIKHAEDPEQWPRPAWSVGWDIFTNPHRLTEFAHLAPDCPGDEFRAGFGFDRCPCFYWPGGRLHFYDSWVGHASGSFGSASAFG